MLRPDKVVSRTQRSRWPQPNDGTCNIAPGPFAAAGPSICLPASAGSIAKQEFKRGYKRMHAKHADGEGPATLSAARCRQPTPDDQTGGPRCVSRTGPSATKIERNLSDTPPSQRDFSLIVVPAGGPRDCVESFLVPRCHRSRDAGRDHQRSRPVAASSVAALISEGNDRIKEIEPLSVSCRRFAGNRQG